MNLKFTNSRRYLAAGSISAVVVALAFVPFNMGGCSPTSLDPKSMYEAGKSIFEAHKLSEDDEDSLGQSVAIQATNRWKVYQDDNLNRYVTLVARVIAASSDDSHIKPTVTVLNTPEVNAFSGPHGYVFITLGALQHIHDESELAGVLAHEVGHLAKHHGLEAVRQGKYMEGFLTAAKGSNGRIKQFGQAADSAGEKIINVGFSQPQEEEADSAAVQYVIAAGYDPNGFLHFLQRVQQEQGNDSKFFGTHPGIADRVQKVSAQIAASGAGGQGATLADRFQHFVVLR